MVSAAVEKLLDTLMPIRCPGCGRRGMAVCSNCLAQFPLYGQILCQRCGVSDPRQCRCDVFPDCLGSVRSAGPFLGWLRSAIHTFKYQGELVRAQHLSGLIAPLVEEMQPDALIAVPVSRRTRRHRGYNQTLELCKPIAAGFGIEVIEPLQNTGNDRHQVGLGAADRRENAGRAFELITDADLSGKRVVIVDDVLTTGATMAACAALLGQANADWIGGVTVAREDLY